MQELAPVDAGTCHLRVHGQSETECATPSSPHAADCEHVWRAACRTRGAPPARRRARPARRPPPRARWLRAPPAAGGVGPRAQRGAAATPPLERGLRAQRGASGVCMSLRGARAHVPAFVPAPRAQQLVGGARTVGVGHVQRLPHVLQALAPASRARIPAAAMCAAASLAARDRCSDCSAQTAHSSVCRGACAYSSWSHTRHRRAAGAAVLRLLFFSLAACLSLVAVKTSTRSASGAAALGLERGMAFHARGRMRAASFAARGRAFGLRVALTVAQLAVRVAIHAHVRYCLHIRAATCGPEAPPGRPACND